MNKGIEMRKWIAALALALAAPAAAQAPKIQLWRLDCGNFVMKKYGAWFSDTFQYPEGSKPLVGSCYLIRHGERYMLWDTGLSDALIAKPVDDAEQSMSLKRSLLDQLREIGSGPSRSRLSASATSIPTIPVRRNISPTPSWSSAAPIGMR